MAHHEPPRIVVTRPAHQADGLARAFERAGFPVVRLPLLTVTMPLDPSPLDTAVARLDTFDWLVLTSANAVSPITERLPGPFPEGLKVAVVGPATAASVRAAGLPVHREAERARAKGLVDLLEDEVRGRPVLCPQAADARPALVLGLRAAGAKVTVVTAYDKRLPTEAREQARVLFGETPDPSPEREIGWVTFTSPRIVRHFVHLARDLGGWELRRNELRALSIGPVTTRELERFGVGSIAEAESPSDEGMVQAVTTAVAAEP